MTIETSIKFHNILTVRVIVFNLYKLKLKLIRDFNI